MIRIKAAINLIASGVLSLGLMTSSAPAAEPAEGPGKASASDNEKGQDKDAGKPKEDSGEPLNEIRRTTAEILAQMAEKYGYSLEEGQVLRRIGPPFPELRAAYYKAHNPSRAANSPKSADAMTFFWDGEHLQRWGMSFGAGYTMTGVIDSALKIKEQDVEGPAEMLRKRLDGDWVIRRNASEEQVLQELEAILQKQFQMQVRLTVAKRVRTIYVATGKFRFTSVDHIAAKTESDAESPSENGQIEIYGKTLGPREFGGGGSGDFKEFLGWLGRWIDMTLIDEVETPPAADVSWHLNEGGKLDDASNRKDNHNPELVLKNVSAQTGLTFKKDYRAIKRIVIEPIE